jgi:acetamidase/formamidase
MSSHLHVSKTNPSHIHLKWNKALKPIYTVDSGSVLTFDLLDGGHNQFTATSTAADVPNFDLSLGDPIHGPIAIKGAVRGDAVKIEMLALEPAAYGWTAILPGHLNFGLLADEFPDPDLHVWDLATHRDDGFAVFKPGIHVPLRPFLGTVGLARAAEGDWSTIPPYDTGGNVDCKELEVGSVLYLPVEVDGGLFSCGDGHAAQGHGEVCGTAIETPMKATIRLSVEKGLDWVKSPCYFTAGEGGESAPRKAVGGKGEKREFTVLGIDADLREASRKALRGLIGWLAAEKGLTRDEAYMLCSVAADLKIAEAVDMPNYAVACSLPLSIFVGPPYV